MLHSRYSNKIKHIHERCLQLIYSDKNRNKNVQALAIEVYLDFLPLFLGK